jgi:S-adenosylmethionine/arginine decarboxylase-like enzyme
MSYWGYHLIIDAARCAPSAIRSHAAIRRFANELVTNIDMVPFGEPLIQHFGSGNKAGYTLVQLIETSNICAHFVEETDDMYLDVFSCKPFSNDVVRETVWHHFMPKKTNMYFLERQAPRFPKTDFLRLLFN